MSILNQDPNIEYVKGDIYDFEPSVYDPTIIITLILAIEQSKPGVLASVLRYLSHFTDPQCKYFFEIPGEAVSYSLDLQEKTHAWLVAETHKLSQNLKKKVEDHSYGHQPS